MNMDHDVFVKLLDDMAWETPMLFLEDPAQRNGADSQDYTAHLVEKHCAWTISELFARQIRENKTDVSVFGSETDIADAILNFVANKKDDIAIWVEKRASEFSSPEQYRRYVSEIDLGLNDDDETLGYGVSSDGTIWHSTGVRFVLKRDNDPQNELGFYIEDAYPIRKFAILERTESVKVEDIMNYKLGYEDKMELVIERCKNESDAISKYPNMTVKKLIDKNGYPMTYLSVKINEDQRITLDCKKNGCDIKLFTYTETGKAQKDFLSMEKVMDMSPELYDLFVQIDAYRHEIYNDRSKERQTAIKREPGSDDFML